MSSLIENLLLASRDAAVLTLVVGFVLLLVGKYIPAGWRHALWLLVAVRLLIPILPTSPMSWQRVMEVDPVLAVEAQPEPVRSSPVIEAVVVDLPAEAPNMSFEPKPLLEAITVPQMLAVEGPETQVEELHFDWAKLLVGVWAVGALSLISLGSLLSWRFWKKTRKLSLSYARQEELEGILQSIARELGWKKVPSIRVTEAVEVPALFGVFKAEILMPPSVFEQLSEAELRLVLMHELGHWKRRDLYVNLALGLLQAIHWLNPLVWLAFHKARVESERATDAWVLRRTGANNTAIYGGMLLNLLSQKTKPQNLFSGVISVVESPKDLKRRMTGIVRFTGKQNKFAVGLSVAVLIGLAAVGLTKPPAQESEEDEMALETVRAQTEDFLKCRVVSSDGEAVDGAKVYYLSFSGANRHGNNDLLLAENTDEKGVYETLVESDWLSRNDTHLQLFVHHPTEGYGAHTTSSSAKKIDLEVSLDKGLPLSFRVQDEDGKPVANTKLRVANGMYPNGFDEVKKSVASKSFWGNVPQLPSGFWNSVTDSEGRCEISGLRAGRYYVDVDDERYAQLPGEHSYKFQYDPTKQRDEIELTVVPSYVVSGTVSLPDGTPVAGALVRTLELQSYRQGGSSATAHTDVDGRFKLERLLPSRYDVRVTVSGSLKRDWVSRLTKFEIKEGEYLSEVGIKMEKGGVITGRITLEDTGEPVRNYGVGATSSVRALSLDQWWANTDEDGYYRHRVPVGKMKVYPGGVKPKGYTDRTVDKFQMTKDLDVVEGGSYEADFTLLRQGGISGVVVNLNGKPVSGANVTCLDYLNSSAQLNKIVSDEKGRFSFTLPVGAKRARIIAELDGSTSASKVKYAISTEVKLVLKPDQLSSARGQVVDSDGNPISGARVAWTSAELGGVSRETVTDLDGYYEAKDVVPNYQVVFYGSKDGYGKSSSHAALSAGKVVELKPITLLNADAFVSGKIIDSGGNPVQGAKVTASGYKQPDAVSVLTDSKGEFILKGIVKRWLDLEVRKTELEEIFICKQRVKFGNENLVLQFPDKPWSRAKWLRTFDGPVDYVGKDAPPLMSQTWLNSAPLPKHAPGKIRVIEFVGLDRSLRWFSNALPELQKMRENNPEKELEIIVVHGYWPQEEVAGILKEKYPDFKLPIAIEPKTGAMSELLGARTELTVVIDKKGKVVFQDHQRSGKVHKKVRELLGKEK